MLVTPHVTSQDSSTIKKYSSVDGSYLGDFIEPGHIGNNLALAFSPNGSYLYASGSVPDDPINGGVSRYDGHTGAFIDYFIIGDSTANLLFNTGRTNTGSNVAVSPTPTTSLAFSNITSGGQTVVTPLNDGATPLPENFQIPTATGGSPTYFDISTTASFTGPVTLGIGYEPTVFRSDINPTGPEPILLHFVNGAWVDITTSVDIVNHKVYGVTNSFSPFAIGKRIAYSWSGLLDPINPDGSSVFKKGSTIPVKFKLTGIDAGITNLQARLYLSRSDSIDPSTTNEEDEHEDEDEGFRFRYDSKAKQYIYNLRSKEMDKGTWYLWTDLGDGVKHVVQIKLKK